MIPKEMPLLNSELVPIMDKIPPDHRVLPAEMCKTLGHRADRLIGGFRAGVLLGERRLVVPGHPVGRVRGDRVPVTL